MCEETWGGVLYISWRAFLEYENGWLTETNNVIIIGRSGMFFMCAGKQAGWWVVYIREEQPWIIMREKTEMEPHFRLYLTNTRICIPVQLSNKLPSSFFSSICSHVQMAENVQDHGRQRKIFCFDYWPLTVTLEEKSMLYCPDLKPDLSLDRHA